MKILLRILSRLALGLTAIISGCPMYGVMKLMYAPPPVSHDPSVKIENFSFTPGNPLNGGGQVDFKVGLNKPTEAGYVHIAVGEPRIGEVQLNDYGNAPDEVANDGIWTGAWQVPEQSEGGDYSTIAYLTWFDGYPSLEQEGGQLTITEPEGE